MSKQMLLLAGLVAVAGLAVYLVTVKEAATVKPTAESGPDPWEQLGIDIIGGWLAPSSTDVA